MLKRLKKGVQLFEKFKFLDAGNHRPIFWIWIMCSSEPLQLPFFFKVEPQDEQEPPQPLPSRFLILKTITHTTASKIKIKSNQLMPFIIIHFKNDSQ